MHSNREYKIADLVFIDGIYKPSQFSLYKERIDNFDVRNDDIWVTSYPKSGTTWCQELVWLIANDMDYEKAKIDLERRFPFLEYESIRDTIAIFLKENGMEKYIPNNIDVLKILDNDPNRRFIKSHLPWNLLPKQIRNGTKTPKMIHIIRNPKQVAVSYYHHSTKMFPSFIGDIDAYIQLFMEGKSMGGCYNTTVLSFWTRRNLPNLLILTYEEMKSNLDSVIERICDFLGKSYTIDDIEKLKHHLHFEQMKKNEAVNKSKTIQAEGVKFLRAGVCDSYKNELSQETIRKMDNWISENFKETGLFYEN